MLTYTGRRNQFGSLINSNASTNLTLADTLMNDTEKRILSSKQWDFLSKQYTYLSDSANQFTVLPMYIGRVQSVYVTVGSYNYPAREVTSRQQWDKLNIVSVSSDIPRWFYVYDGKLGLFPKPSTSGNTVTVNSKKLPKDLSIADYTTGTITTVPYTITVTAPPASGNTSATLSGNWTLATGTYMVLFSSGDNRLVTLTNGATTATWTTALTATATITVTVSSSTEGSIVIGSGTTWTTQMIGRYIQIAETNTANTGDNYWYEIASVPTATALILVRKYGGTAISGGSATYIIGQVSLIPEPYDQIPIYEALKIYFSSVDPNPTKAKLYAELSAESYRQMTDDYGSRTTDVVLSSGNDDDMYNPNLFIHT